MSQVSRVDPVFHAAGTEAAPWFDADGNLVEEKRKGLPRGWASYMD
jgi:hypothetical protein